MPTTGAEVGPQAGTVGGSNVPTGSGPEEIRAATQRRLLGAFLVPVPARGVGRSVSYPTRYGARGGASCCAVSTRHATRRGHEPRARRSRSSPARARARRACSRAASRGRRARAPSIPRHVLAVTFTRKAAGELRAAPRPGSACSTRSPPARSTPSRSRSCAAGSTTPAHDAHAARAQGARPRPAPRRSARGREAGLAAAEAGVARSSGRRRASSRPTGTRARPRAAGARLPRPPAEIADVYRGVRTREAPARARRLRRPHRRVRRRRSSATPSSRPRNAGGSATSSSTSSRTRAPAQFRLLRAWLGDRSRPLRRRRRRPGDLRRSPAPTPSFLTRFRRHFRPERLTRRRGRAARQQLPLHAAGRRGSQRRCSGPPGARDRGARRAARRPAAGRHGVRRRTTTRPRGIARARCATPTTSTTGRGRAWRCSTASTRSRRCSRRRSARAGVPFRVRGGGALPRPARGDRSRSTSCARPARTAPGRPFEEHLTDLVADAEDALRGTPRARRRARAPRPRVPRRRGRPGSVDGFLAFLQTALRNDDGDDRAGDAVELLTFHRPRASSSTPCSSPGSSAGSCPISHAKTPEALDEEQRLLYVALSRAERMLHLSWARRRTVGMRTSNRTPSSWFDARSSGRSLGSRAASPSRPPTRSSASPTRATAWRTRRAPPANERTRQGTCLGRRAALRRRWSNGDGASRGRRVRPPTWCSTTPRSSRSSRRSRAPAPSLLDGAGRRPGQGRALRRRRCSRSWPPTPGASASRPAERLTRRPRTATIDDDDTSVEHGGCDGHFDPAALPHRRRLALSRCRRRRARRRRRDRPRRARAARRSPRVRRPHRARVLRGRPPLRPRLRPVLDEGPRPRARMQPRRGRATCSAPRSTSSVPASPARSTTRLP